MGKLTTNQETMLASWQEHTYAEFGLKNPDAALATMSDDAQGYAAESCCDWVYGKYISLKTGKEVKPPKGAVAPGAVESAASAANRYCAKPAEATAPPECSFLNMKDCRASLKGKAGSCYKF